MHYLLHLLRAVVGIVAVVVPNAAIADEPCAAEAAAVSRAGKDRSLDPPAEKEANARLEAGNRAFRVQRYDKAVDEYTAAGLITSAPLVLYNLGQSLRASKQYEKAIRQYRLFLSRGNPGAELRALVECQIGTMKAELDAAASTAPPSGPPDAVPSQGPTERSVSVDESRWTGRRKAALVIAGVGIVAIGGGVAFGLRSRRFEDDAADLCATT